MHLRIRHTTRYHYDQAPSLVIQALCLWPAASNMQTLQHWLVRIDGQRLEPTSHDGFGNRVATHTTERPRRDVVVSVSGAVETHATAVVHQAPAESLPPAFYLNETALTRGTPEITELAQAGATGSDDVECLHRLCDAVRKHIAYSPDATDATTTAAEAFARRAGVCQDHAYVMIAAAHALGFPARYVSGYLSPDDAEAAAASHAWAEVHVPGLGWLGLDAANRQSPDERYVRVGCGRDYRDAAPVRGIYRGAHAESMEVDVSIARADEQ